MDPELKAALRTPLLTMLTLLALLLVNGLLGTFFITGRVRILRS